MKLLWEIDPHDIKRLGELRQSLSSHPFVLRRRRRNVDRTARLDLRRAEIWRVLLGCLLTTRARSGAGTAVDRLVNGRPFQLSLEACRSAPSCEQFVFETLTRFGGIRRTNTISRQAGVNLDWLESEGWPQVTRLVRELKNGIEPSAERVAARTLARQLSGLGPKQSRNLLQWLGLTRYEIPIDGRVVGWLNEFGFPIRLSAAGLSDPAYYEFVLDGLQQLCHAASLYPCELDAMIFVENEPPDWDGS